MNDKLAMAVVEEAINDLDMCGGEISYRVSDLIQFLEGKNLKKSTRIRIFSARDKACKLVNLLEEIRKQMGLEKRPDVKADAVG